MTGFPALTKRKLFDLLHERARKGERCPSLRLLVKLTEVADEAAAERLLGALQTDGVLHILRGGAYPWVELQRATYFGPKVRGITLDPEVMKPAAPAAPARKGNAKNTQGASGKAREASSAASSGAAKRDEVRAPIKAAVAPAAAVTPMPERPTVETGEAQRKGPADASTPPASIAQGPKPATPPAQAAEDRARRERPAPQPVKARHPGGRPPTDGETRACVVGVRLTASDFQRVADEAGAAGRPVAQEACGLIREALAHRRARSCSAGKYRVRADVLVAWQPEHGGLDQFVETLIALGLERFKALPKQVVA